MRPIDADALISKWEEDAKHIAEFDHRGMVYAAINDVKRQPTVDAEPRWIPVTEKLPEDGTEVWVTTEMLFDVTRACWHKDSNLWCHPYNSDCLLALRPIAWMEMSVPEPWRGEE